MKIFGSKPISEALVFTEPLLDMDSNKVSTIALKTLAELAISLSMTTLMFGFIASTSMPGVFVVAIGVVALNAIIRVSMLKITNDLENLNLISKSEKKLLESVGNYLRGSISFLGYSQNFLTLIHESGHAIIADQVYKNARISIEVFPGKGGVTRFNTQILSKVGQYLGASNSHLLVSSAGIIISMITALTLIAVSRYIAQSYPEISQQLEIFSFYTILTHVDYACGTILHPTTDLSNDFMMLWINGLHPGIAIVGMVAAPCIMIAGLYLMEKCAHKIQAVFKEFKEQRALDCALREAMGYTMQKGSKFPNQVPLLITDVKQGKTIYLKLERYKSSWKADHAAFTKDLKKNGVVNAEMITQILQGKNLDYTLIPSRSWTGRLRMVQHICATWLHGLAARTRMA